MSPGWRTHACGCVASLRSAGRHKWRPYVWAACGVWRRFVRRVGGGLPWPCVMGYTWDTRRGDIHVARMADACMRLCCLPAVGRASQVAPLRVGGLCGVWAAVCTWFGGVCAAVWVAVAVRASQVAPLRVGGLCGVCAAVRAAGRVGWCALYAVRAGCV